MQNILLMPGSAEVDAGMLRCAAREWGWRLEVARSLQEALIAGNRIAALLFCSDALGKTYTWIESLYRLRRVMSGSRLVVCYGFSDPIDWPALSRAGAFHALSVPFRIDEVRQTLGFIAAATARQPAASVRSATAISRLAS